MSAIQIEKESVINSLKELEFLIVSLDRIGSSDLLSEERVQVVYRFVVEGNVFQRLASIRRLLSLALDRSLSPDERDVIDEVLEAVPLWDFRAPP